MRLKTISLVTVTAAFAMSLGIDWADAQGRAPRQHTIIQSEGLPPLSPAVNQPPGQNEVSITIEGDERVIRANGIPATLVGSFPNEGNPNAIAVQPNEYRMPANPALTDRRTSLGLGEFGVAVDGIPFEPGAAEWYVGDPEAGWRYEALSGAIALGLDENFAHVQRTGKYHYHGLPMSLLAALGTSDTAHSPLVGWAGDGFPIYAVFGYVEPDNPSAGIKTLKSSYQLKTNGRPEGGEDPGGIYDGTFIADYEYVADAGDLDACNGRVTVTPEFPDGTYAYFLTAEWPVIPRCFRGTPGDAFLRPRFQD
ncbi:YHYH protein [Bauldia sp.]|uniref:YHYH protein n=1 Tax=Bauldia sp. TaxID=2575872 RepID=UPI003BACE38C